MRAILIILLLLAAGFLALWQFDIIDVQFNRQNQRTKTIDSTTEFFNLVKTANLEQIQQNLSQGAPINARDSFGQTPLMYAAAENPDPLVIEALLKTGAEVNARTEAGWTALMYATRDNNIPKVALTLLQAGTDPTIRNSEGKTALDYAGENGSVRRSSVQTILEQLTDSDFDPQWPSGYIAPVEGATFSSRASHLPGARRAYRNGYHEGFDFYNGVVSVPIDYRTPVVATADGVIIRADYDYVELSQEEYQALIDDALNQPITPQATLDKLRGRQVWIEHPGGFISRYAHLDDIPPGLQIGDRVSAGQLVGYSGNSGTSEAVANTLDGAHPHYEFWRGQETYMGEGLAPSEIYELAAQTFGERTRPPYTE